MMGCFPPPVERRQALDGYMYDAIEVTDERSGRRARRMP